MQSGGPSYRVELGRLDGLVSTSSSVNGKIPKPNFNLDQLTSFFSTLGLNRMDMIALSGTVPANSNPFILDPKIANLKIVCFHSCPHSGVFSLRSVCKSHLQFQP